jgi:tRNA A37 threonylcarbamoyladenosine dehydratase
MDGDLVQASNINRQLPATQSTIGCPKVEVLRERLLTINPDAEIIAIHAMYDASFSLSGYDYIIDAIDSVAAKTDLILRATRMRGVKLFCSMGAALRFDPTQVTTGELMTIKGDALAKAVRARMKRLNTKPYKKVKCVYSTENVQPLPSSPEGEVIKGSIMPVTAVFGCTLASMVIDDCRR